MSKTLHILARILIDYPEFHSDYTSDSGGVRRQGNALGSVG